MRKSKFSLVVLLAACTSLAGCDLFKRENNDDKKEGEVTVTKMVLASSFRTSYRISETIAWATLSVSAKYSNGENKNFTFDKMEFDVETVKSETELVVFTSGLKAQTTLEEGTYAVSAALPSNLSKKYALGQITIGSLPVDNFDLISYTEPANVLRYKSAKNQTGEAAFKSTSEVFTVGTLNEFKFEPVAMFRDKKTQTVAPSTTYEKEITLYEGETQADFGTYAEIVNGSVKFKPAAEGKSFKFSISPKDFPKDFNNEDAKVELNIKVEKGLNIYSAKELGALNLTKYTQADYDLPASRYVAHRGVSHSNGVYDVYWDEATEGLTSCDTTALWKSFLQETGTFNAEQLVTYQDVPAVFFQDDITIQKEDIPAKYFIQGKEGQSVDTDGDGVYDCEGTIRDDVDIYTPMVGEHSVVINGNFFKLVSELGSSRVCRDNPLYYHDGFEPTPMNGFQPGHATLIKFCGLFPSEERVAYFKNQVDHSHTAEGVLGVLKNVNANGNSSADFSPESSDMNLIQSMGSMIFIKNQFCGADYTNNIIKQFQIGLFADEMVAGEREHAGAHGEGTMKFNTLIKDTKVYDCPNSAICNFQNQGLVVESSEFKRYGGAPLLNLGYRASDGHIAEGAGIGDRKAVTVFTSDCSFSNLITSEETYYKAVGASGFLPLLQAYARFLIEDCGATIMYDKDTHEPITSADDFGRGKMNLYTLAMSGSAMLSQDFDHYSDVILGFDRPENEGYLEGMCNGGSQYPVYESVAGMLGGTHAPVFTTDAGEQFISLFSTDTPTFRFSPTNAPGYPFAQQLEGNKITFMLPVVNPGAGISTTLVATFQLTKIAA